MMPIRRLTARRWIEVAAVPAWIATWAAACAAAPAELAEEFRAAAAAQGKIALGEIAAFKDTYLADITIQTPQVGSDGSVAGTATFAGQDAPVLLQYVEKSSGGVGQWLLAWRLPTQNLDQLIPAVGTIAGQGVQMATPVVIFSRHRLTVSSASMAPAVREFYRDIYGSGDFSLSVQDGVNLATAVEVRAEILAGLQMLGPNIDNLVLEGVVLKNFDQETFRKAREQGRLMSTAAKDAELRAKLASGTLGGLPETFRIEDLALLVTGRPMAGVTFNMLVGSGSDQRRFDCRALFLGDAAGKGGQGGLSISARTDDEAPWRNALGIQGLELHSAALELRSENTGSGPPRMLVGVKGDMKLAAKLVSVAGGMTTRQGVPSVFFRGSVNSLTRDDLVAIANDLASAVHGGVDVRVVGVVLPDFDLREVEVLYAPAGGSEELGVPNGVGLKGQLYLFGSRAAEVDALVDVSSRRPRTSVKATVSEFQLGPIQLHEAKLDLLLAASTDSYFRASGGCDLLGNRVTAMADLNAKRSEVTMVGRLAGAFEVDVSCTNSVERPAWQFSAGFKNDFANSFQSKVSDDILAWARQAERDFAKANADLEQAKRDVQRIDTDIANARAQVKRDRATNEAALRRAEADLNRISTDIAKMRAQVKRERGQHLAAIDKAKRDVDGISRQINARRAAVKAQRVKDLAGVKADRDRAKAALDRAEAAFNKAVAAWKKAKGLDKIAKGIDKDAKGIDRDAKRLAYQAKAKVYDAVSAAVNAVPVDADPQIVVLFAAQKTAQAALGVANDALRKIHGTAPIDSDPRVAGLFVGRDTALAAVKVTEKAFELAHRAPVDADPRVAPLFVARDGALAALDASQFAVSATSDAVQWGAKATAAAASGRLLRVESARLSAGLSVFQQGGKMEMLVRLRVMDEPRNLHLTVDTADLASGNLFTLAGKELVPSQKPAARSAASAGQGRTSESSRNGSGLGSADRSRTRQEAARRQPGTGGYSQQWLRDVRALRRDLDATRNGPGWIKYLRLSELEQIAAARAAGRPQEGSDRLQEILATFEKTASDSQFSVINRKASFARILRILRNEAALERQR
jgi:hypothetical protein